MQSIRFLALLLSADRLFALPLPEDDLARVGLAEDGAPLWRFADHDGVWRYPVSPAEVSPYDLDALLTYEDRRFYRHPGVNPLALARVACRTSAASGWCPVAAPCRCRWRACSIPVRAACPASSGSCGAPFSCSGRYQLSVLDQSGQTERLEFSAGDQALSDAFAVLLNYLQSPASGTMLSEACG